MLAKTFLFLMVMVGVVAFASGSKYGNPVQPCTTAIRVYGQADFTSSSSGISATSFNLPVGVTLDSNNNLYVSDLSNERVLFFPSDTTTPTRVYGQVDFNSKTTGTSATAFQSPYALAVDSSNNLYVPDHYNNRVLVFPDGITTATGVYGQSDSFTTASQGTSASAFYHPYSVAVDSGNNLYVTDIDNCRILFFPSGTKTATRQYGQVGNCSPSSTSIGRVLSVALDSNDNLYAADYAHNRVLFFLNGSTTATRVYGQPDFTTSTVGTPTSATTLRAPQGVFVDSADNLYVADSVNHRVLFFPKDTTTATRVYGQPDFTTESLGTSSTTLNYPIGVTVDSSNNLYVAEYHNNRVTFFPSC